jgi:hypothetical protein
VSLRVPKMLMTVDDHGSQRPRQAGSRAHCKVDTELIRAGSERNTCGPTEWA